MEDEDFLAAVEADNATAPVEEPNLEPEAPAAEEAPKPEAETPVSAEPAPAEPVAEAPAAPAQPEPIMVPLAALHETRDKLKALEDQLAKLQPQPQAQPVEIPDRYEDPEGYEAFQEARIQQVLLNQTLNTSERFARKEHGAETVEAAKTWATQRFAQDPLYQAQVLQDPDPYERVVSDYRRDQLFSKVSDPSEFDAFLAWKAAQAQIAPTPPGGAPPPPSPPAPPRSLASAPSAGNVLTDVLQSDEEMFAETFARK